MAKHPLAAFTEPVADWFRGSFEAPTRAQELGWPAIAAGDHTLLLAPTGSGKTLAAFLSALDGFVRDPEQRGTRVLYVSPLKALNHDIERNLRAPLAGVAFPRRPQVALRSGDTSQSERAAIRRDPPDILITTPESLYLMLTSAARDVLGTVETVIVDEIHAVAATKRGAHLALSLERLEQLAGRRCSGSACPRRSGRWRRWPGSWAATARSRSSMPAPPSSSTWRWWCRSTTCASWALRRPSTASRGSPSGRPSTRGCWS